MSEAEKSESIGKPDKVPLWQKIYTREHYADVVRMVGYAGLSLPDARAKTEGLLQKYAKEKLEAASEDLLQFNEAWVRLTTETRRLAWQLLGPPPDHRPVDMMAEIMASGERLKGPKPDKKPKRKSQKKAAPRAELSRPTVLATPIMQQYRDAKERQPGMLLLFRVGDFYELFGEDAETAAKVLGLTLTTRDKSVSMAGFPHHALESYLHKLLKTGRRVAICDPVPDSMTKGPIQREVTRVLMPGSLESPHEDSAQGE